VINDTTESTSSMNMESSSMNMESSSSMVCSVSHSKCNDKAEKRCKELENVIRKQHINIFKMRRKMTTLRNTIHTLKKKTVMINIKKHYSQFLQTVKLKLYVRKNIIDFGRMKQLSVLCD